MGVTLIGLLVNERDTSNGHLDAKADNLCSEWLPEITRQSRAHECALDTKIKCWNGPTKKEVIAGRQKWPYHRLSKTFRVFFSTP